MEYKGLKVDLGVVEDMVSSWDVANSTKYLDNNNDIKYNDTDTEVIDKVNEYEIEELKITNPVAYEEIMEKTYV